MDRPGKQREQPRRKSAVLGRLRRPSPGNVLGGVVVFAVTFGLTARIVAAAVFVAAYTGIQAGFGQRIRERFERQPDLRLAVADGGKFVDTVESSILPPWPWPCDADRVVANEVKRLQEEAAAIERSARKGPAAMLLRATDPFARRPGDQDYQQARERFAEKLDEYVQALRAWLAEYREAAEARVRTFELRLRVISAKSGAYAEDVVLTVDLPEGVEVVDKWPTVPPPPAPPAYVAPRPRSTLEIARPSYAGLDLRPLVPDFSAIPMPDVSFWETSSDGRRLSRHLGNIHHDSTVDLDERVLLRVPRTGATCLPGRCVRRTADATTRTPSSWSSRRPSSARRSHGCTASRAIQTSRSSTRTTKS